MAINNDRINKMKAELEKKMSGGGRNSTRVLFWVPKANKNNIRVMPPWTDDEKSDFAGIFWREVYQHWNVAADQKAPFICTKQTPGMDGECAVCDFVEALKARKTDLDAQELVKKIRAKVTYMLNIVDLKDPTYTAEDVEKFGESRDADIVCPFKVGDPKIQVYAAGSQVFNQILGFITENEGEDLTDFEGGRDITITKLGTGMTTKYEVHVKAKPTKSAVPKDTKITNLEEVGFTVEADKLRLMLSENHGQAFPALLTSERNTAKLASKSVAATTDDDLLDLDAEDDDDLEAELKRAMR